MEPDDADPRPLLLELLLPESSELELPLLDPESSELVELTVVVPLLSELECCADTTATDNPVPPIPSTAVAIAAVEARRNQRRRAEWGSSNASVVTMAVSLPGGCSAALQENVKRRSSYPERSLRTLLSSSR
ncbi:hypothetical protein ACIBL3_12100 [Kribbella sp. NPDC050124]|uniref:hypothetical protein n=1 Tax=Kribbella sp. NPDC050124 TaxID=3364114 RepID=UPI0037B260AE